MKSEAIWVVAPNKIEVRNVEIPEPSYHEVQIETKACGVCAWDSYLYQGISAPGPIPYVIGHEAVGVVTKLGPEATGVKVGDKVFCASGSNAMMSQYFNIADNGIAKIQRIPPIMRRGSRNQRFVSLVCCTKLILHRGTVWS